MRIGITPPRINGVGIGDACPSGYVVYGPTGVCTETPEFRLQATLQQYLTAAQLGQYGTPPPSVDAMTSMLQGEMTNICNESFIPCSSAQGLVDNAVSQYASWLSTQQAPAPVVAPSVPPPPVPQVSPPAPAQVQYSSQPANALDRVTPQASSVTPSLVTSVLAPPTTPAPVSSTNAGTFGSTQATGSPAGSTNPAPSTSFFDQTISIGSVNIPTWALLAGAGLGLFLMTKGK